MKKEHYVVIAYRWGDRERHSYPVGIFSKKKRAIDVAEEEVKFRGGKYSCVVFADIPDSHIDNFDGFGWQHNNDSLKEVYFAEGQILNK